MPVIPRLASIARSLVRQEPLDRSLDEELQSHLALRVDELVASGRPREEARRLARLELGVEQVKERVRETRRGASIDTAIRDARIGVRLLVRNPSFSIVAMLTLALGIGATTAAFSGVHAALLRQLPFPQPDRLVIGQKAVGDRVARCVSRLDYFDFRDSSRSFDGLAAMIDGPVRVVVTDGTDPWQANVSFVTWNLFSTLGVEPLLGRGFRTEDETKGGATVVVISHALWTTKYARSPSILGAPIILNGVPRTIVGVMPAGFRFMVDADAWALVDRQGPFDPTRDSHSHILVGRLKRGVSLEQAQQDVGSVARDLAERFPDTNARKGLHLSPLHEFMVQDVRRGVLLLMAVTAFVLLIACANVTGLLLARGQRRMPEMAMRAALGATRWRLARQLLTESIMLTVAGGLLGLAVARGAMALLVPLISSSSVGIEPPSINGPVLLFAVAISLGVGLCASIVPALRGTAAAPASQMGKGRQSSETRGSARLRSGLVVLQVAVSIVLLVLSGLFLQSLARANGVNLGFDPNRVLTARLQISDKDYPTAEGRHAFFTSALDDVAAIPGVSSASAISKLPIQSRSTDWSVWRADRPAPPLEDRLFPLARWVYPRYFETMRIPLKRGRDISSTDTVGRPKVVVISESLSRALYPNENPLGRPLAIWGQEGSFEIVGVAGDVVLESVFEGPRPGFYIPASQLQSTGLVLVVRTAGDPAAVSGALRQVVRRRGHNALLASEVTLRASVDAALSDFRAVILSLGLFAGVALLLTCVGLYGALAYHVSQQQHELGVRMAVGASRASVLVLVLRRGGRLAGLGLVLGASGAAAGSRLVRAQLFATGPSDPATYAGAFLLLTVVAAVACIVPAWRASRINPMGVLRGE